jgi:hypothetical protein
MAKKPLSEVYLGDGDPGNFWSISFDDLQLAHAEVKTEDMRTICVHVDEVTGELSQSEGYAEGSQENRDEKALFAEFEDAIVREMVQDHRFKENAPFLELAAKTSAERDQALRDMDMTLAELELDLEDEDRDRDDD